MINYVTLIVGRPIVSPAQLPELLQNTMMLLNYRSEVGATRSAFHYPHRKGDIQQRHSYHHNVALPLNFKARTGNRKRRSRREIDLVQLFFMGLITKSQQKGILKEQIKEGQ